MWPALRAVIEGHATMSEMFGEVTTADLELLERGIEAHARGMREAERRRSKKRGGDE